MAENKAIQANPFTLVPHSREKFEYLAAFDIQRWYDDGLANGGYTMRSRFIPMTVAEGRAFVQEHERRRRDGDEEPDSASVLISGLESKIQEVIATDFRGGAVFVRLSTQSPKDVGRGWTEHPRVGEIVREELAATESQGRTLNDRIRALFAASLRVMKVETGKEALDLLLKSERIQSSVLHALANVEADAQRKPNVEGEGGEGEGSGGWDLCVVVREWRDRMRLDREFRTFVVRDRIVAITQYNDWCYYPAWADQHQLIASKIHRFFVDQGLQRKVPREYREWAYVADFVLLGDDEEGEVQLVEINPFGPGTGASLFDWKTERHLLQAGHDLWGDLSTASASSEPQDETTDGHPWTRTTACYVGGDPTPVFVRMATQPNPRVDSSFLSSFGIDILVSTLDEDDDEDEDNYDDEEDEDDEEEEEDENQETIDEFVDEFVAEANLRPVVLEYCGGRFAKRWTAEFVGRAVTSVQANETAQAWLKERGLEWSGVTEKAVARAAKQWYAYCIATS